MRRMRRPLRLLPAALLAAAIAVAVLTGAANGGEQPATTTVPGTATTTTVVSEPAAEPAADPCAERVAGKRTFGCGQIRFDGHGPEWWAREARQLERLLKIRWRPTVDYALRLAAAAFPAVGLGELRTVARCESGFDAYNVNPSSGASGLFQFLGSTWRGPWGAQRFHQLGFDVFDPVANALAAAFVVTKDGGWGQWVCKP